MKTIDFQKNGMHQLSRIYQQVMIPCNTIQVVSMVQRQVSV